MHINNKYLYRNSIFLILSIVTSMLIQIYIINDNDNDIFNDNMKFISQEDNVISNNYEVKDNLYIAQNNDPQLLIPNINNYISGIEVNLSKPVTNNMSIQIFLAKENQNFSEENSIIDQIQAGRKKISLKIPYEKYSMIRIDIGHNEGDKFNLSSIKMYTQQINFLDTLISKIGFMDTIKITIFIFAVMWLTMNLKIQITDKREKILERVFIVFCFIMFMLWAIVQPYNSCPDEHMRYDVIKYIFDYNKLPHGGDSLIRNEIWGFSYAFLPYLSGLVSVVFMKFTSVFTMDAQALILAARMAVVLFGTATVYYVIKIANNIFKGCYKWLFIILVCCLPQFVFIGSYMNNDMLALLSVAMMIYYWMEGHEKRWDKKSNIGLAIAVSICMLAYYNVYPFILFSVVFFIWSNLHHRENTKVLTKKFIFVASIVFILTGWWFIRNAIIYNGDFLGLKTLDNYSNMYALKEIKRINRINPLNQGISIWGMLFDMQWIKLTYLSFLGMFGYMSIRMEEWMYAFYKAVISIGMIGWIIKVAVCKEKGKNSYVFYVCIILSSIIVILLSAYSSYTNGFQPQGRYVIGCLIPLMILVTVGFQYLFNCIESMCKYRVKNISIFICLISILILVMCFTNVILPAYSHYKVCA